MTTKCLDLIDGTSLELIDGSCLELIIGGSWGMIPPWKKHRRLAKRKI
ncbi:hypothetical protein LCGC14_1701270 [marine sediment metagenome]|uniref:Uncharacterized protein n=1 Tax=marine sediment metagenome TaxID=412755 RepID=A0A0F9JYC4_9ZZZZ